MRLFSIFSKHWVIPRFVKEHHLTLHADFGRSQAAKVLQKCAMFALMWSIWIEHNSCIFQDKELLSLLLWDKMVVLVLVSLAGGLVRMSHPQPCTYFFFTL